MWLIDIVRPPIRLFYRLFYNIKILGTENVPEQGGCIIASNHLAFHDPVIIAAFIKNRYISFLAKQELFKNKLIGALLGILGAVPVSRGLKDTTAVKNAVDYLKGDNVLCIFPEGTRVKGATRVRAKKGTVRIAQMSDVPIIPVHIKGRYRLFAKMELIIGKPIRYAIDENNLERELTEKTSALMDTIYNL